MAKFILKIVTGSDAMQNPEDIGNELIRIGTLLKQPELQNIEMLYGRCRIRDTNGNTAGAYQVVP